MQQQQIQRLQLLVHDCLSKHLYASAIFYADKLVSLSGGAPADIFTLAQVSGHHTDQRKLYRHLHCCLRGNPLPLFTTGRFTSRHFTWTSSTEGL